MSAVANKPRARRTVEADTLRTNFERGRDVAIKMIDEGRSLSGERECYRRHRPPGVFQDNYVDGYLSTIISNPELSRGFASVLSQVIGAGESFEGSYFKDLTFAETQGGEPGADGTQAHADPASQASPLLQPETEAEAAGERIDPYSAMLNAVACIDVVVAQQAGTDVHWALHSLIAKASDLVCEAHDAAEKGEYSALMHERASSELAGVLGLVDLLDDGSQALIPTIETLVTVCKNEIDRTIREHLIANGGKWE